MHDRNLYKVLQVDPSADADVISAAYRALAGKLHPDRDITGVHEVRMAELNRAYAVLRDPAQRKAYDDSLRVDAGQRLAPVGPGGHSNSSQSGSLAQRIQARESDNLREIRIDFGRYSGWTLGELVRTDPDYLRWLSRHSSGIRHRRAILTLLGEHEASHTPLRVPQG